MLNLVDPEKAYFTEGSDCGECFIYSFQAKSRPGKRGGRGVISRLEIYTTVSISTSIMVAWSQLAVLTKGGLLCPNDKALELDNNP